MPYEHLTRHERRAMVAYSAQESKKRPAVLSEIPRDQWPMNQTKQTHVWHSKKFLVQMFDETPFQGIDTRRISVCRVTLLESGRWEEGISWEELMQIKREIGFGDWYGLEIFPRDADIVNVANMRHLWLLAVPLNLGWFRLQSEAAGSEHGV
jgi:hypothetical protein